MKYNYEKIALAVLQNRTLSEAAKQCEISEATLYRIRQNSEFRDALHKLKREIYAEAMITAQVATSDAIITLRDICQNEEAPASSRVSAASKILEIAQTCIKSEKIMDRIEALESTEERKLKNEQKENFFDGLSPF